MNNYQTELLVILMEECGETTQEICKILRFGLEENSHHTEGKTHLECLTQEMGDLLAMISLVRDSNLGITDEALETAKAKKLTKVVKWMKFKKPQPVKPAAPGSTAEVMQKAMAMAKYELGNYKRMGKEKEGD